MSAPRPEGPGAGHDAVRPEESFLRGGIKGVALVTLATAALAGAGAVVALLVALLF